jgi:hypothetical protein
MKGWWARLRCRMSDHIWLSDIKLSTDGIFAVIAGLWFPPATCRRCGAKKGQINERFAKENGWLETEKGGKGGKTA